MNELHTYHVQGYDGLLFKKGFFGHSERYTYQNEVKVTVSAESEKAALRKAGKLSNHRHWRIIKVEQ